MADQDSPITILDNETMGWTPGDQKAKINSVEDRIKQLNHFIAQNNKQLSTFQYELNYWKDKKQQWDDKTKPPTNI